MYRFCLTAVVLLSAATAEAGGVGTPVSEPEPIPPAPMVESDRPNLIFTLGAGVRTAPEYFGSESSQIGPDFGFRLGYASLGPLSVGRADGRETYGLGVRGSFRYIGERTEDEFSELRGLDDVDATYELGLGLGYSARNFDAFADLRYGFFGHETLVGEVGANLKVYPTESLTVRAGPRLLIGSGEYSDTYFSVSPREAAASGGRFDAFDADAGIVSAGVQVDAEYDLNGPWGLVGAVTYNRLVGDAADSPIVEQGDRDQYGLRIGITRQITLGF